MSGQLLLLKEGKKPNTHFLIVKMASLQPALTERRNSYFFAVLGKNRSVNLF
jgi:hypothetical protein